MFRFFPAIILLFILISSCEKTEDLDLPETDKRLVVEGIITNEATSYTIKLSRTKKYSFKYNATQIAYEVGAKVILTENDFNIDTLVETSTGIFNTHPQKIRGKIGSSYAIDIYTSDGKHYRAKSQEMFAVPKVDSIYFDRNTSEKYQGNSNSYRYNVYIDWYDPKEEKNYYMFIISYFWNNTWQQQYQWNTILQDYKKDGSLYQKVKMVSDYGQKNFSVRINMYSLTKANYDYWRILYEQKETNFDGFVNNTVPLVGNILNVDDPNDYVLGYFQVSATSSANVYINY